MPARVASSTIEVPLDASNVMPVCPECGNPTRVGAKIVDGVQDARLPTLRRGVLST